MLVQAVSGQAYGQLEWALSLIKFFLEGLNSTCVLEHLSKSDLPGILQRVYESVAYDKPVRLLIRDFAVHFGLLTLRDDLPEFHAMHVVSKIDVILDEVVYGRYDFQKGADAIYDMFSSSRDTEAYPLIEAAGALLIHVYLVEHESLILRMLFLNQNLVSSLEGMFFSPVLPLLNSSLINDICQFRDDSYSSAIETKDFDFNSVSNDIIENLLHVTLLLPSSQAKKLLGIILLCIDRNMSHFSDKVVYTMTKIDLIQGNGDQLQ
ncbi:hypothetical protein DSO57_1022339 [Entomophthora muscae]|uniref:Uncharacterized protein n=1 Tax=Entomophthora muscae TaxID=34485 RepID=A0ACC2U158_9FUNG|nr:hypothetical protein DSO57_1022339 [Entomophthora muscae]